MSNSVNKQKKGLNTSNVLFLNLLVIISVLAVVFYYNILTNTLEHNGKWVSSKTKLDKCVMGAFATLETHRTLAKNKLDLGSWHGNQELFLKKSGEYDRLSFKAKIEQNGHFSFFYELNGDTLKGIRISYSDRFPSMHFTLYDGEFIQKEVFPLDLKNKKWIKVKWFKDEQQANILQINRKHVNSYSSARIFNTFGLRGSERSTLIDNITLSSKSKGAIVKEKFNKKLFTPLMIAFSIISLLFFNLSLYLLRNHKNILVSLVSFGIVLSFGLFGFEKFYNQYRYKAERTFLKVKPREKKDKDIVKTYKGKKKKDDVRILFLGSSQTYGAGASKEQYTFVNQFSDLAANAVLDTTFVCINAGVSGQTSVELIDFYRHLRKELKPDISIINLSYNDAHQGVSDSIFSYNMQQFININNEFGIPTIFIPEPNNPDFPNEQLQNEVNKKRQIVTSIAHKNNVRLVELQPFIEDRIDDGFLFWDVVHLTDFGQKLFAEELFNQLKN